MQFGTSQFGVRRLLFSVSSNTSSLVTGWFSGAPSSFQFGNSSVSATGSITAPLKMCAPGSEPFSSTTTDMSLPSAAACCLMRMAVASPPGPAPTTSTSYSIASRGPNFSRIACGVIELPWGWRKT